MIPAILAGHILSGCDTVASCAEKWCLCGYGQQVQADWSDVRGQTTKSTAAWYGQ